MPIYDSFKSMPDQMLEVLKATQDIILTTASSMVETTKSLTPVAPPNPFSARMAEMIALTEAAFTFAERVLASQKEFSIKLLSTYLPPKPAARATLPGQAA